VWRVSIRPCQAHCCN